LQFFSHHLLSVILFTPAVGALAVWLTPKGTPEFQQLFANLFGVLGFLVCIPLIRFFPSGYGGITFQESYEWIPSIGARYALGLDGIGFLLVLLTSLLGMIAIYSSWPAVSARSKEYYISLLLLQTGLLGIFVSQDFFLFYVFWEATLVPIYFLIAIWGGERRLEAANKFVLCTLAGSVLMLLAVLSLSYHTAQITGVQTFDMPTLLATARQFPDSLKVWLFWGFFLAFAVKVPMFPFHTWMPDAHTEAPTAVSLVLAGALLKTGTYGLLNFCLPLLPADPAIRRNIVQIAAVLSLVGIIYGAAICLMQTDLKRLIAYSSLSTLGFCTLGIFTLTPQGVSGSVLQQINHGISTGALFLLFGMLYERRQTFLISEYGGISTPMPGFATIFLIISLSSVGMPLLNGFVGQFTILQGVFAANHAWTAWCMVGILLTVAYVFLMFQRIVLGPMVHESNKHLPDLSTREYAILLPLVALAFWIGIYPKPFFSYITPPVNRIVGQLNSRPPDQAGTSYSNPRPSDSAAAPFGANK
jgi:NADH-quinone oxidoreductase subunit M